jgi:hypothetical protein
MALLITPASLFPVSNIIIFVTLKLRAMEAHPHPTERHHRKPDRNRIAPAFAGLPI